MGPAPISTTQFSLVYAPLFWTLGFGLFRPAQDFAIVFPTSTGSAAPTIGGGSYLSVY